MFKHVMNHMRLSWTCAGMGSNFGAGGGAGFVDELWQALMRQLVGVYLGVLRGWKWRAS